MKVCSVMTTRLLLISITGTKNESVYFYLIEVGVGVYFVFRREFVDFVVMFDQERRESFATSYKITQVMSADNFQRLVNL